jgi:aspartate aminotransferase
MVKAFRKRHDYVLQRLRAMPGVTCLPSDGTFYSFPCVQSIIDALPDIENDVDFAAYLLEKVGLALVPGSAFGAEGHVRLSFAASQDVLESALNRLETVAREALS